MGTGKPAYYSLRRALRPTTPRKASNAGQQQQQQRQHATTKLGMVFLGLGISFLFIAFFVPHNDAALLLRSSSSSLEENATTTTAFSLLVTLVFQSTDDKDEFLTDIAPVADYVQRQEPDTLAYEVLLSDQDPLQVMILERYRNKDVAYLEVHKSSAPFLAFRPKLQAMQEAGRVTVSGHSYLDSNIGFGDRLRSPP